MVSRARSTWRIMSQSDLSNYNDVMVVPKQEVVRFISETLQSLGLSREVGDSVGHSLMYADYRGIFNHGIFILDEFIKDFKKGLIDGNAEPTILHDFQVNFSFSIVEFYSLYLLGYGGFFWLKT